MNSLTPVRWHLCHNDSTVSLKILMCEHTTFLLITGLPKQCTMRWVGGRFSLRGCLMYATFLFSLNATNSVVVKILLASGAHLSRYLIQIAIHHYFHTQGHFIKSPWVRNVPLRVFTYFLKLAEEKYGEIPRGKVPIPLEFVSWYLLTSFYLKGEDDGSVFANFLKESRFPPHLKSITWENVKEIMDTYKVLRLAKWRLSITSLTIVSSLFHFAVG